MSKFTQPDQIEAANQQIVAQFGSCSRHYGATRDFLTLHDAMMKARSQELGVSFNEAVGSFLKENRLILHCIDGERLKKWQV